MQMNQDIWKAVAKSKELLEAGAVSEASDLVAVSVEGASIRNEASGKFRNLIVAGPPRSGKSLLADQVKQLTAGAIVNCDTISRAYHGLPDAEKRLEAMDQIYSAIFRRCSFGLIIVGDEFVTRDCASGMGIDFMNIYKQSFDVKALVIGCDQDSVDQKFSCIEEWRKTRSCWTNRNPRFSSEESRKRLANYIIGRSKNIRRICQENDIDYRSIHSSSFMEDIGRISQEISSSLRAI